MATINELKALAQGSEVEGLSGRILVKFDYYNPATGEYRTAIRSTSNGVPHGQLPPGSVVIPSSLEQLSPGPQMADGILDQGPAATVKAAVYDLQSDLTGEIITGYRGRAPAGWTVLLVHDAIEVDVPVRVVLGHDPAEALLAEARGENV